MVDYIFLLNLLFVRFQCLEYKGKDNHLNFISFHRNCDLILLHRSL